MPPILRLSPDIRRRIYQHFHPALGPEHFKFSLHGGNDRMCDGEWVLGFHSLLLSCRTIYEEASQVLYSTNVFEISYKTRSARSLRPLRNLRDASLSSLRELKVVLNEASCHHEKCRACCRDATGAWPSGDEFNFCQARHADMHDEPLRPLDNSAAALFDEWRLTTTHLSSRITPAHLSISLVCDFDPQDENALSAAAQTTAPLFELSPLKGCHVRLSKTRHSRLEDIARESVLRALGIIDQDNPPSSPTPPVERANSRLLSLPPEIRFRILEYTDLITPFREIRWSRQHKGYLPTLIHCKMSECPAYFHSACHLRNCWYGLPSAGYDDPRSLVGCFCRARHAAFSFNCQCWAPPTDLFLVCRTLYRDAQAVFFSGNRFVVHDFKSMTPACTPDAQDYPNDRFAVSKFLRDVVPGDCLHLLRSLELTFPPYSPMEWPQEGSLVLCDWAETVRFIKEKMNLKGLTLRLTMLEAGGISAAQTRWYMTGSEVRDVLQAHDRILRPIAELSHHGLKRFYAHIALPEKNALWFAEDESAEEAPVEEHFTQRIVRGERQLKQRAEQLVLGDRYSDQPEDACYWNGFAYSEPFECVWRREFVNTI